MTLLRRLRRLLPSTTRNHLFGYVAGTELPQLPALSPQYRIVYPCAPEAVADNDLQRLSLSRAPLQRRLAAGDRLAIVFCDDRAVHRSMIQFGGYAAMVGHPKAFRLANTEGYVQGCETAADQRGRGLYPHALQEILRTESARGIERVYIACVQSNVGSVRGILKAGFAYTKSSLVLSALLERMVVARWYLNPPDCSEAREVAEAATQ